MTRFTDDWFLTDWMRSLQLRNVDLERMTGWDKRKVSFLVSGRQPFARDTLVALARAMNLLPFELLMDPDDAMALRRLRDTALTIAADVRREWRDDSVSDPFPSSRTAN
jgi:hypothetical protein